MHLIIGGAYQGKRTYALTAFSLTPDRLFSCSETDPIDFSYPCITNLEAFVYGQTLRKEDAVAWFCDHRAEWEDKVLICRDIFSGIVPIDPDDRAWREQTGKLCQYLAQEAETVTRIFCGLPQKLK